MKIKTCLTIVVFLLLLSPSIGIDVAQGKEPIHSMTKSDSEDIEALVEIDRGVMIHDVLPNGTQLLVMELPSSTIAYGMISVKVGGRYESEQNAGISHLLEHLILKESEGPGPLTRIRETGGTVNALTDMELTSYHFTVLPEHFEDSMATLTRIVLNPRFDERDLKREREVVLEELAMGLNDPRALVLTQLVREIFPGSPLASFVIGTKQSINAITYSEIMDLYDTYYTPANMIVIAAGKVHARETLKQLRALFGTGEIQPAPSVQFEVPKPALRHLTKKIPIKQSFFIYGSLTPGKTDDDFISMEVLDILFGSGVHSRLHRRIVMEGGYTEQLYPNWHTFSNTGIWAVFLSLNPGDMDTVSSLIREEMDSLRRGAFSNMELEAAKRALIARVKLNLDRPEDLAWFQLENLSHRNRTITVSEYVHALQRVQKEDVMHVAQTYFSDDQTVTIEMRPARGPGRLFLLLKYLATKSI
jgi:predicted Zn-dependent peptidase